MDELLIARIAGLPASAVEPFDGGGCESALRALRAAEAELGEARRDLGDHLHRVIAAAASPERRLLLAIKRACFNGRSLSSYASQPAWRELLPRLGPEADGVLRLEERLLALEDELDRVRVRELQRESRHLLTLAADPALRRGLALSSPSLVASLARLESRPDAVEGRREHRARMTLLRYVSRAALKLSPFSTLTRFALARVAEAATPLRLLGSPGEGQERSLVRLRRYLVEQVAVALSRCRPLRESLPVALNPSLREAAAGRYRLLYPAGWTLPDDEPSALRVSGAAFEVPVASAVVDWLRDRLGGEVPLHRLIGELAERLGAGEGEERARSLLERLIQLGVLVFAPPWSCEDARLEQRLLAWVGGVGESPPLDALARSLGVLVELEESLPGSLAPAATVRDIESRLEETWRAAREAAGLAGSVSLQRRKDNEVYEDVLLLGASQGESLEVGRERLEEAVRDAAPWFRLVALFAPRHELLHTFAALARRRWPENAEIGALELFEEVLPLWPEIRRLVANPPSPTAAAVTAFNPLGLLEIEALGGLRQAVWSRLRELLPPGPGECRLAAGELRALTACLPRRYQSRLGPCLFLQPADLAGERWVLNRVFEGTGRYASRVTPLLPAALRRRFIEPLISRSTLRDEDGEIDLLDLVSSRGDTLNVHAVQTRRVLVLPGEPSPVPAERRVDPSELRVRCTDDLPVLVDGTGRRLLPVHLGAASLAYMPPLVTFLSLFGVGEVRPLALPRSRRRQGEAELLDRVVLGRLVLARRRWIVPAAVLRKAVELPPTRAFAALARFRQDHDLPPTVFAIERVRFGTGIEVFKPQYLDLRSPSFCELLAMILRGGDEPLVLEEALPAPDAYPGDTAGERWAVELQLDTLSDFFGNS